MVSYFDEAYYLRVYADVRQAVGQGVIASGFEHYQRYGGAEGRSASASFFGDYYLATNPDVKAAFAQGAFATPLVHFEQYGLAENRVSTSAAGGFDAARYLSDFPDVAAAVAAGGLVSALDHYLRYGAAEGRPYHVRPDHAAGVSLFDEAYYLARNADVAAAVNAGNFTSGLQHFQVAGAAERRAPSADFDARHYEAVLGTVSPGSLQEISSGQYRSSFDHFQQVGLKQNWAPVARVDGFDPARYLADNPDVAGAVAGGGFVSALDHYLRYGSAESRPAYTTSGDTLIGPDDSFLVSADLSSVNEGGTVVFTLQTTNVAPGAQYKYTLSNIAANDIEGGAMSGIATVGADGKALIPITLAADATTDGADLLRIAIAGQTATIMVNDTSQAPGGALPVYTLTGPEFAIEGDTVTFALQTGNMPGGRELTYSVVFLLKGFIRQDLEESDIVSGTVTTDADGRAALTFHLKNDGIVEGRETMAVAIRDGSSTVASAQVGVYEAGGAEPRTLTLTSDWDSLSGAAGNDIFNATYANGGGTFGPGDSLNGFEGTDTLSIVVAGPASLPDNWSLQSVEKLVLSASDASSIGLVTGPGFRSAFQTGVDLTARAESGAIVLDLGGGSSGYAYVQAATITAISTGGSQTVTTGGGNDTVTSSAASGSSTTISTGAGNDTIVAGFSTDLITGGLGADTMTGGGGVDTFAFAANGSVIGASMDAILDFNAGGGDVLTFAGSTVVLAADSSAAVAGSNVQTSAGGLVTFHTADNTLALKTAAVQADAELDAAGSIAMFAEGGNTYVYYAGAASGNLDDQLVQLTGIAALTTITGGTATTIA